MLRPPVALPDRGFRSEQDLAVDVAGVVVDLFEKQLHRAFTNRLPRLPDPGERDA